MADIEPPTKRICLVAPKGSVANNPFRMLPPDIMSNIKAMKSDKHPPTPTAMIMKFICYELRCDPVGGTTIAWIRGGEGAFKKIKRSTSNRKVWLPWGRANFEVRPLLDTPNPALGVVVTPTWTRLRQHYDFEDALDYMETIASDHGITDWNQI